MKKYLIFLIALALLVTAGIFAVSAETQAEPEAVWCDRCRKNVPANEWMEWTATGGEFLQEGHFYLADTFNTQETTVTIPALKFVCFDLRGNTWITEGIRTLNIDGDFSMMDSIGGGLILTTGAHLQDGGFAHVSNVGALNIYGGTIRRIVRDDITLYHGGLINIACGTVNLYGGTVAGGVVEGVSVDGSNKTPRGGNIYMAGGTLNVSGGTIENGMLLIGTASVAQGGNIYATAGADSKPAKITISDGAIKGGFSEWDGGNIFLGNATLTLSGNGAITDGHAVRNGGNMSVTNASAVVTITGGCVTGGVAGGVLKDSTSTQGSGGGGNIYGYMGTLNIADTTIDGNIKLDSTMSAVTLSGVTKIGLGTNAGMMLSKGMALNVENLEAGSEIFVRTYGGAFTAAIPADQLETIFGYFKGAVRTQLTMDTDANTIQAAQGTTGYCPHCYDPANPQQVTWTAASGNAFETAGHYYLSSSQIAASNYAFYVNCVLDLNGYTLQRTNSRVILAASGVTLDILDSVGGGRVIGTGTHATYGTFQMAYSNDVLTIHSGNLLFVPGADSVATPAGGMIYSASAGAKVYIKGGVISGGSLKADSPTGGGNIYLSKSDSELELSAGIIKNGNAGAANGGNIYSAGKVKVTGGVILGGSGAYGGNIYTTKEVEVTGGIIWNGTGTSGSGNIYTKKATVSGGTIAYGNSTTGGGGNLRLGDATSSVSGNAVIHSGRAATNGGNIYCVQSMTLNIQGGLIAGGVAKQGGNIRQNAGDCTVKITDGKLVMGTATDAGGNAYINNGKLEMTGGVISLGTAPKGGNIYLNNNVYGVFKDDGDDKTPIPVVTHGTATTGNGGNIAFMATGNSAELKYNMQLGNCRIYAGTASGNGDNVYIDKIALFEVLPEFAQRTTVYFHDDLIVDEIYLDNTYVTCDGMYAGELLLENRFNLPKIITSQADPTLVIGQAALVMQDGSVQWFGSNAAAMEAYTDLAAYIQPGAGDLTLPAGVFVVDLAGQNVTLSGNNASVYCFDSANTSFTIYGTAKLSGPALLNTVDYPVNGVTYVTVEEAADTYSFHCLDMQVSSVSVRPGSAGIYYSCTWECDDVLKTKINSIGVAVSTANMPDANFATDTDTLYTKVSAEDMEQGKEYNSVLINNIFDASADNNSTRGATPIYATPYVTLDGDKSIVCSGEFKHSLQSVLKLFDAQAYYANKPVLEDFYQKWESAMNAWGFANIGVKPQDDDTLRILMVGNSFCYYYVEELYGLLMENLPEGVTAVEVYNLYASGRRVDTHYDLWTNNKPGDYQLFKADTNGRRQMQPNGKWTLEEALAVGNWDYISLQGTVEGLSYATEADRDPLCAELDVMAGALLDRFNEMFPYTQLLWHRTWNQEVGRVTSSGFVYTEEYNARYDPGMQYVCDYMTEVFDQDKPYDLVQVNSGAAWTEARRLNAELIAAGGEEAGLLPYGGLCAMLARNTFGDGRPGSGDGQHDGDIGGGQLLNAYMWYMTITGDSNLTDNDFKPDYEMSDELWNMLKQAAMTTYETYYK